MHHLVAIMLIIFSGITASAQHIALKGVVSNRDGTPLPDAIVTLEGYHLSDTTDASGAYSIEGGETGVTVFSKGVPPDGFLFFSRGILSIRRTTPSSPLKIDLFDINGKQLRRIFKRSLPAGEHRFDLSAGQQPASLIIIRVSIGQQHITFRNYPEFPGSRTISLAAAKEVSGQGTARLRLTLDHLNVSAAGHFRKSIPITSYNQVADITVDPVYGTFLVSLLAELKATKILGALYTAPIPSAILWKMIATKGNCRLLTPRKFYCPATCNGVCDENDVCRSYPDTATAGNLTVSGPSTKTGMTNFTIVPLNGYYQPLGLQLAYPPCAAGTPVTFSAAGNQQIASFTLATTAIGPIELLNDSITAADGQPVTLRWTPPGVTALSTIVVMVDFSYHGGTKAKIECDCPDTGSLTIPASLLDTLKTFGISGFPKLEIYRRSLADTTAPLKVRLVCEANATCYPEIPGVVSCTDDDGCPEGMTCDTDQRCR